MNQQMHMIAYCGLNCAKCPTYAATQKDDDVEREKVAKKWSQEYKITLKPSDMNCDGCKTEDGRLFGYCRMCEVRSCGKQMNVQTCVHCNDYECDKIQDLVKIFPDAKEALGKIKATL
jgi:hypothetical protein